jgi:hypothetical protein
MATVRTFIEKEVERVSEHTEVEASVSQIEINGEKFIQMDTYGSKGRAIPGKTSQPVRLTKESFEQLSKIAKNYF